jgi:hypothetical protein
MKVFLFEKELFIEISSKVPLTLAKFLGENASDSGSAVTKVLRGVVG